MLCLFICIVKTIAIVKSLIKIFQTIQLKEVNNFKKVGMIMIRNDYF